MKINEETKKTTKKILTQIVYKRSVN